MGAIDGVNYLWCDNTECFYNNGHDCICKKVILDDYGRCDRVEHAPRKQYKIKGYKKNSKSTYTIKVKWDEEEIEKIIDKIIRGNRSNLQLLDDAADFRKPKHIEDKIWYSSKDIISQGHLSPIGSLKYDLIKEGEEDEEKN